MNPEPIPVYPDKYMPQPERRIRRLKLTAPGQSELQQARYVLEEAFRTATMPDVPPQAEVVMRRLDLGKLPLNLASNRLSGKISSLVRELLTGAVCADEHSCPSADAVWFSDPLQPYRSLLRRLLDGGTAREWYWRSLFPGRDFALNSSSIEWLLLASRQTPLKKLAPSHLLQAVLESRCWSVFLSFLTPALARRMLHEAGLSPVAAVLPPDQQARTGTHVLDDIPAPVLPEPWRQALKQAVEQWGEKDVRCSWLAWQALVLQQPAWLERSDVLQRIKMAKWVAGTPRQQGMIKGDEIPPRSTLENEERGKGASQEKKSDTIQTAAADTLFAGPDSGDTPVLQTALLDAGFSDSPFPNRQSTGRPRPRRGRQEVDQDTPTRRTQISEGATQTHPLQQTKDQDLALFSPCAGFAFVIPLLQRIALPELLKHNEQLIGLDFPRRVLLAMGERFRLPKDDPVRCVFESLQPDYSILVNRIHLPDSWRRMTTVSGRPLQCGSSTSLNDLIRTTQLMASLYLRRFCRLYLRGLIRRPGRVVVSTTHWDVLFALNQTDLRLRRVALDSDPGWVPWLGRVVQFHYHSE